MEKDIRKTPGFSAIVVPSFSPIENMRMVPLDVDDNDKPVSYRYMSDAALLLNQERLISVLGEDTVRNMVNAMNAQYESSLTKTRREISDKLHLDTLKSRYLQSACEIKSWMKSLGDKSQALKDFIVEQQKAAEESQSQSEEPVNAE